MKKSFEQLYYRKMLYFSAGKNMLTDNYDYYRKLVNDSKICTMADKILKEPQNCAYLADSTGCRAASVLKMLADIITENEDVYIIEDDLCTVKPAAIYSKKHGFVMHCLSSLPCTTRYYNLDSCYRPGQRRRYTSQRYLQIAKYYFEKSEYIENMATL